jgi:hypothetical protein
MVLNMVDIFNDMTKSDGQQSLQQEPSQLCSTHPHGYLRLASWRKTYSHHLDGFAGEVSFRLWNMIGKIVAGYKSGDFGLTAISEFL